MNKLKRKAPASWKAGDSLELTLCGVKTLFRYCPPGTFLMGSPKDEKDRQEDEFQHKVTLTRGFWLLETPVTQTLWKAVTRENPSYNQGMDAAPAENLSWEECNAFVRSLNAKKLAPEELFFDFPTEAEWEYACRAGTTTRFNCGDELTVNDANFDYAFGSPTPVKSYPPNAWGLYDMHGNVYEWCADWYDLYPKESTTDPKMSEGVWRTARGGCWFSNDDFCRSAARYPFDSKSRSYLECVGLRLAMRWSVKFPLKYETIDYGDDIPF